MIVGVLVLLFSLLGFFVLVGAVIFGRLRPAQWNRVPCLRLPAFPMALLCFVVFSGLFLGGAFMLGAWLVVFGVIPLFLASQGILAREVWAVSGGGKWWEAPWAGLIGLFTIYHLIILAGLITQAILQLTELPLDTEQPAVRLMREALGLWFEQQKIGPLALMLFQAVILAPLWEELFFRGTLYPWLKSILGRLGAMILSSTVFAVVHVHAASFLSLMVLAMTLCLVYERRGRLADAVFLHLFFNLLASVLLIAAEWPDAPS